MRLDCISRKLRERRGFTLLEVILATAMVSIFFAMAAMIIPTWYKAYTKTTQLNHARQIADSVMGAVEGQVRFANQVEVLAPTESDPVQRLTGLSGSHRFQIPMQGSTGYIDGLVYDEDFFLNHELALSFSLSPDHSYCDVTVEILAEDGSRVLQKQRAVMLSGENP